MAAAERRVLIADHKNADISAEIPFLFKKAGCTVEVYCARESWLLKNKSSDVWHEAAGKDAATYADGLIACALRTRYDRIVLADDDTLRIMNECGMSDERARMLLPLTKLENRALLGSKAALSLLSAKYGLCTPPFAIYHEHADADALAATVSFPLLLKVDHSGGGSGIFKCMNIRELHSALRALSHERRHNLVFQKYIQGDEIAVEAMYTEGVLLMHTYSRVVGKVDGEFSVSLARRYENGSVLTEELKRIGSAFGLNGFCNFTFMYDSHTQTHYLIEADLRPHAWFALARHAGADFSHAILRSFANGESDVGVGLPILGVAKPMVIYHFFRDVNWSLLHGDIGGLARWLFNIDGRWKFMPLHDRKTFIKTIESLVRTQLYRCTSLRPFFRLLYSGFYRGTKTQGLSTLAE